MCRDKFVVRVPGLEVKTKRGGGPTVYDKTEVGWDYLGKPTS